MIRTIVITIASLCFAVPAGLILIGIINPRKNADGISDQEWEEYQLFMREYRKKKGTKSTKKGIEDDEKSKT